LELEELLLEELDLEELLLEELDLEELLLEELELDELLLDEESWKFEPPPMTGKAHLRATQISTRKSLRASDRARTTSDDPPTRGGLYTSCPYRATESQAPSRFEVG